MFEKTSKVFTLAILTESTTALWLALAYSYPYLSSNLETLPLAVMAYFSYSGVAAFGSVFCAIVVFILSGILVNDLVINKAPSGGGNDF